jgi:hypothetical protein
LMPASPKQRLTLKREDSQKAKRFSPSSFRQILNSFSSRSL